MGPPRLVNLDVGELCSTAGGDPWKLDDELQAGNDGAINALADAFHQAGNHVTEADDDFNTAKRKFIDAYRRNDSEHPINTSEQVQRASAALAGHQEQLSRIAVEFEEIAASLAVAQRDSDDEVAATNTSLDAIDDQISAAKANRQDSGGLHDAAVSVVRAALGHVEEIRGAYVAQLHAAETAMMTSGYTPDVLDAVDGVPGDAPADAARRYDQSGRRAADQAAVDKATAEGRSDSLVGIGRPGYFTIEESDAEGRLHDYKTVTAPPLTDQDRRNPVELREDAQGRRFAGERLQDYNLAQSTGPVPKDPVLGGDARTQAQTRLKLQRDLENGNLSWHQQPMVPDEATQLMDQIEVTDRSNVLAGLQEQLQNAGMTPQGAAQVTEGMSHGVVPQELVDGASAAGKSFDAGKEGVNHFTDVLPTGRHWEPGVAFSPEDVEALKKLGGRVGAVGSVLELGVGAYEIFGEGKPPLEVGAKAAGGLGGMWLGAEGGGLVGGTVAGPPGAFVGALILGTAGAFGGEWSVDQVITWLKE